MRPILPSNTAIIGKSSSSKSFLMKDRPGYRIVSPLDSTLESYGTDYIKLLTKSDGDDYIVEFVNIDKVSAAVNFKQGQVVGYFGKGDNNDVTVNVYKNKSKIDAKKFFESGVFQADKKEEPEKEKEKNKVIKKDIDLDDHPELRALADIVLSPFKFVSNAISKKTPPTGKKSMDESKINEEIERIKKLMK